MPDDPMIQFVHSATATIISVVLLLSGIVQLFRKAKEVIYELTTLVNSIKDFIRRKPRRIGMKPKRKSQMLKILILFMFPTAVFAVRTVQPLPLNVVMMNGIWAVFNEAKESNDGELYMECIKKSEALIAEFEPEAQTKQEQLIKDKVPVPKPGIRNEEEKKIIWDFGPLHEVAAAWWVKGRSLQSLGKTQEAIGAYQEAAKYPHALVYDPNMSAEGGFWSPSENAIARIKSLSKK